MEPPEFICRSAYLRLASARCISGDAIASPCGVVSIFDTCPIEQVAILGYCLFKLVVLARLG